MYENVYYKKLWVVFSPWKAHNLNGSFFVMFLTFILFLGQYFFFVVELLKTSHSHTTQGKILTVHIFKIKYPLKEKSYIKAHYLPNIFYWFVKLFFVFFYSDILKKVFSQINPNVVLKYLIYAAI